MDRRATIGLLRPAPTPRRGYSRKGVAIARFILPYWSDAEKTAADVDRFIEQWIDASDRLRRQTRRRRGRTLA